MACNNSGLGIYQNGIIETELCNASGNLCDLSIRVSPGITGEGNQFLDWPAFDAPYSGYSTHAFPPPDRSWKDLSEGALCASLANRASGIDFTLEMIAGTSAATLPCHESVERAEQAYFLP